MDLSTKDLERLLSDIDRQPDWRTEADKACAYYDGHQLSPQMVKTLRDRGQPEMTNNLIGPVIDSILGMEAKTRQGARVRADNDSGLLVAEALNEEVNEVSRMTDSDRGKGDAFASQIKAGIGWVEFNPSYDPFEYDYRCNSVHRNEIWWDWTSRLPDLSDARWLIRRRWADEDELLAIWPQHADLIKYSASGWNNFMDSLERLNGSSLSDVYREYGEYNFNEDQLFDIERRRSRVHEVYYRVFVKGVVMRSPDGRVLEFDRNNRLHVALAESGRVEVMTRPFKKMYMAWYIGAHKVWSGPSPHPHNTFPYVPFWGFREDETGAPYGLIRRMISPQDEVNFRRSKLTYLLNAKLIVKEKDAVTMSDDDLWKEINAADGIVTLNPARQNKEHKGFWVEEATNIAAQQFTIMQEAKQQIQDCAGVFSAMMGQDSNATSGVAISGLVEQGATTMAELFDNYRFGSKKLYELMLAYKVNEIGNEPRKVLVNVNQPEPTKEIALNETVEEADGTKYISNDVTRTKAQVVLEDIVNTPGYRAQISERMMNLVQALPPNLQVAVFDLVIMSTDVPQKEEFLKRIRRATGQGVNPEDLSPEERTQWEEQQKQSALQSQLQMQELMNSIAKLEAETQQKLASAAKDQATADSIAVKDDLTEAQTLKVLAELRSITNELISANYQRAGYLMPRQQPIEPTRQLLR